MEGGGGARSSIYFVQDCSYTHALSPAESHGSLSVGPRSHECDNK